VDNVPVIFWLLLPGRRTNRGSLIPDINSVSDDEIQFNLAVYIIINDADGNPLYWHIQRRTTALESSFENILRGLNKRQRIDHPDNFPLEEANIHELVDKKLLRIKRNYREISKRHSFGVIKNG